MAIELMPDQRQLGMRLRRAREEAGFTQVAAADALGLSAPAVNQYESGKRGVDALTLERLGRLYGVPLRFFFDEEVSRADWESALLTRTANISQDARAGVTQLISAINDLSLLFERTKTSPSPIPHQPFAPLPDVQMGSDVVAFWAEKTRSHFNLGVAPLPDLRGFLEAQGFLVFAIPLGRGDESLSGLYFRHPDLGPIIALNADQAYTRRPFTMAHELAHALFHYDRTVVLCRSEDRRPIEHFANSFAASFLVPSEALLDFMARNDWRQIQSPEQVVHLSRYFGVSYLAMRHRLLAMRKLDMPTQGVEVRPVALAKTLGYHPSPFEFSARILPPEERLPRIFLALAVAAFQARKLSAQRVAEMLGIGELEFTERLIQEREEGQEEDCA